MKKTIIILSALLIALGLTQCKKNEQPTDNQDDAVTITLQIKGNDGTKVLVNTETGSVDYEVGDQIFVASAGKYVGTLTYNGIVFAGAIANATEGLPLQFYFFGNIAPAETLTSGITESCSVVITDQTAHMPVISAAPSYENYYGNVTDYTAIMRNKCALVKFNVTTSSTAATCIKGVNNKVTVNFSTNELGFAQVNEGVITLPAGNGEKWAILLPQDEVTNVLACSADGKWEGTCGDIPAITANSGLPDGIVVTIETIVLPEGALNGLFTINANGDKVYFSQGNLQYIGSAATPYWQFAEHQWDYFGNNGQNSNSQTADRDLFCWGTSGYNHGASAYQPWATSTNNSSYYAYGNSNYNLYDQTGQADWGYNAIANGGNQENFGWRTLKTSEWVYVFNSRTGAASKKGHGKVNGVNGMILLPDDWTLPEGLTFTSGNSSWANVYSSDQWTQMEANGAVFLPAAGSRDGFSTAPSNVNYSGCYWSSSNNYSYAYYVGFESGYLNPQNSYQRNYGYSVRLVRNAE